MIDPFKAAAPKTAPTHSLQFDLSGLQADQLLELRARVDSLLPEMSLKNVNVERELVAQLKIAQNLQRETLDSDTPANQKSQVVGTVAAAISSIAKLQTEVFDSERMKRVEKALIETLQELPGDVQDRFLLRYEQALRD